MVRPSPDPTASLFDFLAGHLRFLRLQKRLTQAQVGEILGCTKSQVSKYESGDKRFDERDCRALDAAWDTGGLFTTIYGFAKLGTDPNWRTRRGRYLRQATDHHIFVNDVIPIPFQTESYARCLLQAGHAAGLVDDVDVAVKERLDLQTAILDCGPRVWAVLDEVVLRPMGGPTVMAAQRDRLLELTELIEVSVRILPLSAAPHIGLDGSFWCFTLPGRRLAAFSGSALGVGRVIEDQAEAADVAVRFEKIAARAWSEDQSRERIARMGSD